MTTHYLRFADQATWESAATEAGFRVNSPVPSKADPEVLEDRWTWLYYTHDWAIDAVGTITRGGEYDPETGDVIAAPEVLDGWHVNFAGTMPDGWDDYLVKPANPYRVFA